MSSELSDVADPSGATSARAADPPARLHGDMGTVKLVLMVLAYNAPLGCMAAVMPLAVGYGAGLGTPLLYLVLGVVMLILTVGYTVMARKINNAGALYTYVRAGLGRPLGLGAGFVALFVYGFGLLYTTLFMAATVGPLISDTFNGPSLPWWVWMLLFTAGIGVLGYLRIDISARVVGILVAIEVAAVLGYDAVVVGNGGATGNLSLPSLDPSLLLGGGLAIGALFALSSFSGFETTAVFRDEVRDPVRAIPRAAYITVTVIAVFYAVGSWLLIEGIGQGTAVETIAASPGTAFFNNVASYLGPFAYSLVILLLVTSGFASVTTLHNVIARYLFNMGGDGVLPRQLSTQHPRFGSPHRASLVISAITVIFTIAIVVSGADPMTVFVTMSGIAGFGLLTLLAMVAVAIAAYLLRKQPDDVSVWHRAIAPVIAAVAMTVILIAAVANLDLLSGSRTLSVIAVSIVVALLAVGVVVALALRSSRPEAYERIGHDN